MLGYLNIHVDYLFEGAFVNDLLIATFSSFTELYCLKVWYTMHTIKPL